MSNGSARHRALVLLGPTGSGKTPLGDLIEQRGLWELPWVHFDFGVQVRQAVAEGEACGLLCAEEVAVLGRILQTGALLENDQFPLAERILRRFLCQRAVDHNTCVVLNGLPRHVDQAKAVDQIVEVGCVLSLRCTREAIFQRIRNNLAGDRTGRTDDDPELVAAKLDIYQARTLPVVEHYRAMDIPIRRIVVTAAMTAEEIWRILDRRRG